MRNYYNCRLPLLFLVSLFSVLSFTASAQQGSPCDASTNYLYWTGEVNNDFFNEGNWRMATEDNSGQSCNASSPYLYQICPSVPDLINNPHPDANTLEPGAAINFNLYISSATVAVSGNIFFGCAQLGLTLASSTITVTNGSVTQGVVSLNNESTVYLQQGTMSASLSLNFLDAASWVYFKQDNPLSLQARLSNILVNDVTGSLDNNFRINQFYQIGSVIRPLSSSFAPAKIYSNSNLQGSSADVNEDIIYKGASVPNGMNNNIRSFKLKRGFMATLAVNDNGTGKSRVYIASESDLTVNTLDVALQGNVSFIRVVPWNWVIKKGTGGFYDQLNTGWFYNWNNNNNSLPNYEYVPMAWGAGGALPAAINLVTQKKKTTHVLGFNESDNCEDQSGQFNNLCQPAVAVAYYENLMSLGVRLGTPAPRENGPTGWLKDFADIAKARDVRFDFVAVHWYDWGSNPANSPNADPQQIFNRFKTYLASVYNIYKLPIWITEFNANPNRGNPIQDAFLRLALPYLESLDYVERYAYFQPNSAYATVPQTPANYYENGALTNIGELYMNHISSPSIPEATVECPNNLDGLDQPYVTPIINTTAFEAECGKYIGNQWTVLPDANASNGLYINGDANLAGATTLAKQIHFEFETSVTGSYRVYMRSSSTGTGTIKMGMDGATLEQLTPFTSTGFTWFQIPRIYDLGTGMHRLTIEFPNANIKLDQIVISNGIETLDALKKDAGYCTPSDVKFGLDITDVLTFYEAENATRGSNWSLETSTNTGGGAYLKSANNITSPQPPTGTDNHITFTINVAKADEYELWAKIKAINAGENSLWIAVDDEPYRKWDRLGSSVYEWYWKKFHYSYGTVDRSFSYFLSAGQHTVKIAIAGGNVHVDRIAVATKGKIPSATDPDVLLLNENLEFEAETATFLGTIVQQNCVNSSNGIQVNMAAAAANGVRFQNIIAATPGAYKLKVSYMSKDSRSFKVIVNGVTMGRQITVSSGNWCYIDASNPTLGSPAIHEVIVNLNRGINTIDIKPWGTGSPLPNSPFIDKIKLEKAPLTDVNLEAELAEIVGSTAIVACNTASNGALVSPALGTANGIRYNNILCSEAKTYDVDISYISKVARNLRISVNGGAYVTYSFDASGNWCFEGGSPKIKTIPLALVQGVNTIEMRATTADAPFLDKIAIKEQPISNVTFTTSGLPAGTTSVNVNYKYYTNPTTLSAALNAATDFTASVATNKEIYFSYPAIITVPGGNVYSVSGVSASGGTVSASLQSGYNNQLMPTQPRTITGAYQLSCAVPSITTHPIDRAKTYGDTARLALVATGTDVSYQWQINTGSGFVNITSSTNNPGNIYTGFNSAQLDIASLIVSMSGYQYKCVITNSCGSITANTVSLTVNPAIVSITANNKSKTYGEDNPTLDATINGIINGDVLNYSLATTAVKSSTVNNYPITVSIGLNSNYSIIVNNGSLTINARNATITANNQTRIYGDDNPILDAIITGTVNDDILNYSLSTTAMKFSDVGGYPISVSIGSNANYNIVTENGSLQVGTRNATITANNQTKTYGDDNPILDATISGTVNGDILNYSLSTTALKFSDIGNYPISVLLGSNANYNIVIENGSLQVGTRNATVKANNQTKTYGDDNPILDATISGTVNGDILNYSLSTTAMKFSDIGNYPISVSLSSNVNYKIATENGSLQVGPRTPLISCPTNITVNAENGKCGASVNFAATETQAYPAATITYTENGNAVSSGAFFATGVHTITATATNVAGSSTCSFTIEVKDTEKPLITVPTNVTIACSAPTSPSALGTATATDNCSATVSYSDVAGSNLITRTWTATDPSGNSVSGVQVITIQPFSASVTSVPTSTVYTGGNPNNLYLGYGAQSSTLKLDGSLPSLGAPYTYSWSGGSTNMLSNTTVASPVFTPTTGGYYTFTVTVKNKYECAATATISICVTDIRVVGSNGAGKVYLCHVPNGNPANRQTLSISVNAVDAHLTQHTGDRLGSCDQSPCASTVVVSSSGNSTATTATKEVNEVVATSEEELKVTVMPNPSTSYFTLKLESKYDQPVNLRVMDGSGRVVDARSKLGSNSTVQIGQNYSIGTYYAELIQGNRRKVVELLKVK